jgi:hypothetical protein
MVGKGAQDPELNRLILPQIGFELGSFFASKWRSKISFLIGLEAIINF